MSLLREQLKKMFQQKINDTVNESLEQDMEESEFTLQLSLFAEHNVEISGKELMQAVNKKIRDIKNGF